MREIVFLFVFVNLFYGYLSFDRPVILARNGNLEIGAAPGRNIELKVKAGGKLLVQDEDVSKTIKSMSSSLETLQQCSLDSKQALDKISNIEDELSSNNVFKRLNILEGYTNNTKRLVFLISRPMRRRINNIQKRLSSLVQNVAQNECNSSPCQHGGTCQDLYNTYNCLCPSNWAGTNCENDVNECEQFRGTELGCQNDAKCVNTPGSYECKCTDGWYGVHCIKRTQDCNNNVDTCVHGTCIPLSNGFKCLCDQGWKADANQACTVDINECDAYHPPCSSNPPVKCINLPGTFYCGHCPAGYTGSGLYCSDINECEILNGGCSMYPMVQCVNVPGSRICGRCPPGYNGDGVSCTFQGVCMVANGGCHPLAQCRDNPRISNTYVECICPLSYHGDGFGPNGCIAGNNPDACASNPCMYGTCVQQPNGYTCNCTRQYTGRNCDIRKDGCSSNPCQNGGTCRPFAFSYICACPSGFSGPNCQNNVLQCGHLLGSSGSLMYPPADLEFSRKSQISCAMRIETKPEKVLNITIHSVYLPQCIHNYLQIHDGRDTGAPLIGRYCDDKLKNSSSIISDTNSLYLWLKGDALAPKPFMNISWISIAPVCGSYINITESGTFKSPGAPQNYPPNRDCYWKLQAPLNKRIKFTFYHIDIGNNTDCTKDYIALNEGLEINKKYFFQLCKTMNVEPILSPSNDVTFHLHTVGSYSGFLVHYSIIDGVTGCGGIYTHSFGTIFSSREIVDSSDFTCEYKIQLSSNSLIKLHFTNFTSEIESGNCNNDMFTLSVYSGADTNSPLAGRFCGRLNPPNILIKGSEVLLVYKHSSGSSFELEYSTECGGVYIEEKGLIQTNNYPKLIKIDKLLQCQYTILRPPQNRIQLEFNGFDIGNGTNWNCQMGSLSIYSGEDTNTPKLKQYCNGKTDEIINIDNNAAIIKYTVYYGVMGGFSINYKSIATSDCGGIRTDTFGSIESPKDLNTYENGLNCTWQLSAPSGYIIQINWLTFNIEDSYQCNYDFIAVYDNATDSSTEIGKYCGNQLPPTMTTTSNMATIYFQIDDHNNLDGFYLTYRFVSAATTCTGNYFAPSGLIRSPLYPLPYSNNRNCIWTITVPLGQQIQLNITAFNLELSPNCRYDYLHITNGGYLTSPTIGKYCGTKIPKLIYSHTHQLTLQFVSDKTKSASGFEIQWTTTATGCGGSLSSPTGSIISPNYPEPYNRNAECFWKIAVAAGSKIQTIFADLDLEYLHGCHMDYVNFYDGVDTMARKLGTYCRMEHNSKIVSSGNHLAIKFHSDINYQGRGFHLQYSTMCKTNITGFSGVIESPNFPNAPPRNQECEWEIKVSEGNTINITFSHFFIGSVRNSCDASYLKIEYKDPNTFEYTSLGQFCDAHLPDEEMHIKSDAARLTFHGGFSLLKTQFRLEWVLSGCGGSLTRPEGMLQTPNYPNGYPINTHCEWHIQTEFGKSIAITFFTIDMELHSTCELDYIHVYNGPDKTYPKVAQFCHSTEKPTIISGTGRDMYVHFVSDSSFSGKGFNASYRTLESKCGGLLTATSGILHSPNYPSNYDKNDTCEWLIQVQENHLIDLVFDDVDLLNVCNQTYIKVYDGPTAAYPLLTQLCGSKSGYRLTSRTNHLYIELVTLSMITTKGFMARYSTACGARIQTQGSGLINYNSISMTATNATNCTWTIIAENPQDHILLTFTEFQSSQCQVYDSTYMQMNIYDGENVNATSLGSYCEKMPGVLRSSGNTIFIYVPEKYDQLYFKAKYSVVDTVCGGSFSSEYGEIATPNYPASYPADMQCEWSLSAGIGNEINLIFSRFDLMQSINCNEDYLEIRERDSGGRLIGTFCGNEKPINVTAIESIWMYFKSEKPAANSPSNMQKGFLADFTISTFLELTGSNGTIVSPLYPNRFMSDKIYKWQITVQSGYNIEFEFDEMDFVMASEYCYGATLSIMDGTEDDVVIKHLCAPSSNIKTTSNVATLVFQASNGMRGALFKLRWKEIHFTNKTSQNCEEEESILLENSNYTLNGEFMYPRSRFSIFTVRKKCSWRFNTQYGRHFRIKLREYFPSSTSCFTDKITLSDGNGYGTGELISKQFAQIYTFCPLTANNQKNATIETEGNSLMVQHAVLLFNRAHSIFKSNVSTFKMDISDACGGVIEKSNGVVIVNPTTEPNFTPRFECKWKITVPTGKRISLNIFSNFTKTDECDNKVQVYNGHNKDSPLILSNCGLPSKTTTLTTGSIAYIIFSANHSSSIRIKFQAMSTTECGEFIDLTHLDNSTVITSPNYPNAPNVYAECIWQISAPNGEALRVDFLERFDLESTRGCKVDGLEIKDGGTPNSPLIGLYCNAMPGTLKSLNNRLHIRYYTNSADPKNGFKAKISIAFCGGTVRAKSGNILSPGYKRVEGYPTNITCEWELIAPEGHTMNLTFNEFDMPWYAKINILDVESYNTTDNEIYTFKGELPPNLLQSAGNKVIVKLFTGKHAPYRGFKLSFQSSLQRCGGELTNAYGTITSPNYPSPMKGRGGCEWLITVPKGRRVKLFFDDLNISREPNKGQGIACFSGDNFASNVLFLTDLDNHNATVRSSDNVMKVYYWSHGNPQNRGFKATYTSDEPSICAQSLKENGVIYRSSEETFTCTWQPKPTMTKSQTLAFTISTKYDGKTGNSICTFSKSAVYISQSDTEDNGAHFYSNILRRFCNTTDEPYIVRTLLPYPRIGANQKYNHSYFNFTIKYKVHNCGGEVSSPEGTIVSPTVKIGNIVECAWRIVAKEGEQLVITSNYLNLNNCDVSYLLIYNGRNTKSPLIGKYCGDNKLTSKIQSQRHFLWLEYHGDNSSKFNITFVKNSNICGGIHHDQQNKLQSPQYPNNYDNNVECLWELRAQNGYHIELQFNNRFQLEQTDGCTNDYLSMYENEQNATTAVKYCGRTAPSMYKSAGSILYVLFRTNQMVTGSGFSAEWKWSCGGQYNATNTEQFIESPGYPNAYGKNLRCEYIISTPGKYIRITFHDFDLEKSNNCNFDRLICQSRNHLSYRKSTAFCGDQLPNVIRFYGEANLTLITDRWVNNRGFKLSYQIDSCGGNITEPMLLQETSAQNVRPAMTMYYSPVHRCIWSILAPSDKRIVVKFLKVNITYNIYCFSQFVSIIDDKGAPMTMLCGDLTNDLPVIHSNNNNVTLKFQYYDFGRPGSFVALIDFVYGPEVGCGGFINLTTSTSKEITFKPPGDNYDCIWHAFTESDYTIKVQFNVQEHAFNCTINDNNIYAENNKTCCIYYQIRDGNTSLSEEIFNGCDMSGKNPISFTSSGNFVQFRIVGQNKALPVPKIVISRQLSICGHLNLNPTNDTQYITSPNFPQSYPKDIRCIWRIRTKYINSIHLSFKYFKLNSNLENITSCDGLSRLEIVDRFNKAFHLNYDLVSKRKPTRWELNKLDSLIGQHTFCRTSDKDYEFSSTQNHIQISFVSLSQPQPGEGFKIEYKIANFNRNYTGLSGRIGRLWQIQNSTAYIVAPENYTIALFFASTYQYLSSCANRWFDIYDGNINTTPVAKLCGGMRINPIFSTGNMLIIKSSNTLRYGSYTSDMTYIANDKGRGCGGEVYMFKGTFTSPLYPNPPTSKILCTWNIRVPMGLQIAFNIKWLDITGNCQDNYIKISDPQQLNSATQKYCSKDQPAVYISPSGTLTVEYKADSLNTGTGWKAAFMAITSDYNYEKFESEK